METCTWRSNVTRWEAPKHYPVGEEHPKRPKGWACSSPQHLPARWTFRGKRPREADGRFSQLSWERGGCAVSHSVLQPYAYQDAQTRSSSLPSTTRSQGNRKGPECESKEQGGEEKQHQERMLLCCSFKLITENTKSCALLICWACCHLSGHKHLNGGQPFCILSKHITLLPTAFVSAGPTQAAGPLQALLAVARQDPADRLDQFCRLHRMDGKDWFNRAHSWRDCLRCR
ncbi:PREDICTED: uncharacterized protein LOC106900562 [Calidris pugnax]|uniref:uncharacterized protein LOC106900562 n=1 Tax=Calidris pugnax TaxID=198806 RepID=UPI00071CD045|nr:PREDICTED: uncharacterized protein LOC106900562 [Calidris pugnax]